MRTLISQKSKGMKDEWISVKDRLPEDDSQLTVFIHWSDNWKTVIQNDVYTWADIKIWRKYDLANNYTHWMPLPLPSPPNQGH